MELRDRTGTLKLQLDVVDRSHDEMSDLADARLSVFKYIETFYNPLRVHHTLGYLSPDQYEAEHAPAQAA